MIVRERSEHFVLVRQHDHALLSGELAKQVREPYLARDGDRNDAILAVCEHDRSWIGLDATPVWNDRLNSPYSFMDYPLLPKLLFYKKGLDEICEISRYAGLLCSMHFASFFTGSSQPDCAEFWKQEQERQIKLTKQLNCEAERVQTHFRLLQLCDQLSLYVCMNEPGASKEDEHIWYKDGFHRSEWLIEGGARTLQAKWTSDRQVELDIPLFKKPFTVTNRFKAVPKRSVRQLGIDRAYHECGWTEQVIQFTHGLP